MAGLLTLCAHRRVVHAKPDPVEKSVLDGGRARETRGSCFCLSNLVVGKWLKPQAWDPKKGEGEGHLTPAPTEEAFRSDLPAEPHQEAHGRAGKLFLSNFHQVESPVFNAKRVSCRWHSCAAEYRGRGAPKKVAFTSDLIPPTWKKKNN